MAPVQCTYCEASNGDGIDAMHQMQDEIRQRW